MRTCDLRHLQELDDYMDTLDFGGANVADTQRQELYALAERVNQQLSHSQQELETLVSRLNRAYDDKKDDPVRCFPSIVHRLLCCLLRQRVL